MRMKIKNRILASVLSFLIIIATAFSGVTTAKAAEGDESTKLADGFYQTLLNITNWDQTTSVTSGLRVSQRAIIIEMSNSTVSALQFQVTGYSQYDAIYMVKQDATNVSEIDLSKGGKIGEWTDITNYDALKEAGYVDSELNDSFVKLSPDSVDEKLDTAVFTVNSYSGYSFDCMDKIGLVGCVKKTMSTVSTQCNSITIQADPAFTKTTKFGTLISYNDTSENLCVNMNSWQYGKDATIARTTTWNKLANTIEIASSGALKESCIDSMSYTIENGELVAKIYPTDEFKKNSIEVYEADSRACSDSANVTNYKAYLAGNYGVTWGTDNLYNADEGYIKLTFNTNELLYGKEIKIITSAMSKSYYQTANICISENDYGPKTISDDSYGILYKNNAKMLLGGEISIKATLNSNENAIASIKKTCGEGDYIVYTLNLYKNGEDYSPAIKGNLYVPIPDDWEVDKDKFYAESTYTSLYEGQEYFNINSTYPDVLKTEVINGHNYLVVSSIPDRIMNGGNIAIGRIKQKQDVSNLTEGVYKAEVGFLKSGYSGQTSMASGTLDSGAYLVVDKDGNKSVYLGFHGLDMGTGGYAYMGALWNSNDSDVTYYDFETTDEGKLLDNNTFDAIEEFACVKAAKVDLSASTWNQNELIYMFKVIPPAMGSGDAYNYVYSHPIDADLVFFSIEKMDASTVQLPTYQKSVLRRSIDKAERYTESAYSAETWAVLAAALSDGKEYYSSLAGKDAGTDAAISEAIKTKSDAIENAIKALAENSELTAARENLKKAIDDAEKIELGDKTVSAFNTLADAISEAKSVYERSNVSLDTINTQIETLNKAVETFNSSAAASKFDATKLADGEYKVYVDMKKIDKTTASMSNNAIDHWMNLSVKDGVYTATLDFKGMTISGQFGYLMNLNYYDAGYTYTSTGDPSGTLKAATVLTTQKNDDGSDVIDNFNSADSLYPDTLSFPLVDKGTQEYVPLQVFVPVMENITAGTGTQNVLMKVDWTSLKSADDTTQDVIDMADGLYTVTGELRETDSDAVSAWNSYVDKVRLIAKDGKTTAYIDFKANGKKSVTAVSVDGADAVAVKDGRAVVVLPQNVEYTAVKLTDSTGANGDARLYLALRSAAVQNVNKAALKSYIDKANALKTDGKAYTDSTLKTLNTALAAAKKVYADEAAIQSEVGAAGLSLKNAVNGMKVKTDISPAVVSGLKSMTYTGKTLTQDKNITVKLNKKTLVRGTDYKVSYKNNKSRGTATVTITGIGNYTGTKTATFKIIQKVTPEVTLSKTAFAYTGKVVTPAVTVKLGGKVVSKTNYTVTMSGGRKSLGTYKVKVTMKGYYSGSKTVTFKIVPKGTSVTKTASYSKAFAVRWGAQKTQTTGYQIQYSTSSKFKSGKTVTVGSNTTVTKKVTGLAANKKYYVRVRTYRKVGKTVYYSAWSKAVAVKTK